MTLHIFSDHNNLNGTIPWEISLLTSLQKLKMNSNQLYGTFPSAIGTALSRIETIQISENQLSGQLPDELGGLENLSVILFFSNLFTGSIPPKLAKASRMRIFNLSNNKLNGTIPEFQTHGTAKEVYLSNNLLTGTVPLSLTKLNQLAELHLEKNNLSGVRVMGRGSGLPNFPSISNISTVPSFSLFLFYRHCMVPLVIWVNYQSCQSSKTVSVDLFLRS